MEWINFSSFGFLGLAFVSAKTKCAKCAVGFQGDAQRPGGFAKFPLQACSHEGILQNRMMCDVRAAAAHQAVQAAGPMWRKERSGFRHIGLGYA
ncbi:MULTISPECIES: hypothetical protein [Chryseobacterium]|uniref:Uncharacterized protein n=1 Tax=Chryseobacterium aquaticum subsp. greenlandense TaxID=345663 RepID=A0A101CG32_9FLAO|nr:MULTISPECIES: hypothetical protein [Chryseobacterium]KUJ55345.1 hypothetical protein AR686_13290 [Chryseobacterium aquaticum subsp. greenlandense]